MAHHVLKRLRLAAAAALVAIAGPLAQAAESIVLASTTSTEQSGLFGHILPIFEKESGITVKVVALGTGQALDVGRRGDADALLVHDRPAEDRFVAEGYGAYRRDVMYNDFVVVGPAADPAAVKAAADTADAFRRIAGKGATRISIEHILPNLASLLIVQGTIQFSLGILAEAGLSYVGLGAQPPTPSWGRMLAESQTMIAFAPRLALVPGIAIVLTVLGFNLLGDGLRDLLDPRMRRARR